MPHYKKHTFNWCWLLRTMSLNIVTIGYLFLAVLFTHMVSKGWAAPWPIWQIHTSPCYTTGEFEKILTTQRTSHPVWATTRSDPNIMVILNLQENHSTELFTGPHEEILMKQNREKQLFVRLFNNVSLCYLKRKRIDFFVKGQESRKQIPSWSR